MQSVAFTLRAMQSMLKIAPGNFAFTRVKKQNQRNTPVRGGTFGLLFLAEEKK